MNDKLMAMLRAKKAPKAETPKTETPDVPEAPVKNAAYHHEQVRRHLEKGIKGTRRTMKVAMKLAKYHHDCACGMEHS